MFPCRAQQCFFRHQGAFLKGTADTDTDNHGRTGIRSRILYRRQDSIFDTFQAICRFQHKNAAHIFTSKALGRNLNRHAVSGHNFIIEHAGCIVPGIDSQNGISNNGFPKVSFCITKTDSFLHCLFQASAFKMNLLSHFQKNDSHSGILTDRDLILFGNFQIFRKLI